mmetsp:Transcript_23437/g.31085  ORF Transcript_23437/g.31085 Transcript_23437/m.31085 type:complete len:464 (-) Transcript_23437:276-1667(-)
MKALAVGLLAGLCHENAEGFAVQRSVPFTPQRAQSKGATCMVYSSMTSPAYGSFVQLEQSAERDVGAFQEWAFSCGVEMGNGFYLAQTEIDGKEDWYSATSEGGAEGEQVLYIPGGMILSAANIAAEFDGYADAAVGIVEYEEGMQHLIPQFYLFLKVLMEYEQGVDSPYFAWLNSLPRQWNTAVSMDTFCMSCLPPYIRGLCQTERDQCATFKEALQPFEYLSPDTKANDSLLAFAYNVVFTRSFPTDDGSGDTRIAPMADMLNHGYPDNASLMYDPQSMDAYVILKDNVEPGEPLTISYGQPTNPSRFLATYGFLNEAPATYCKILFTNPSQELIDVGYSPELMLFYTDGTVAQPVWDVLLYSRLEKRAELSHVAQAFYQAHMTGDEDTKNAIHAQYQRDTCNALLRHLNHIIIEIEDLKVKMYSIKDASNHPRLPLLTRHHDMVIETFKNVREYVTNMNN